MSLKLSIDQWGQSSQTGLGKFGIPHGHGSRHLPWDRREYYSSRCSIKLFNCLVPWFANKSQGKPGPVEGWWQSMDWLFNLWVFLCAWNASFRVLAYAVTLLVYQMPVVKLWTALSLDFACEKSWHWNTACHTLTLHFWCSNLYKKQIPTFHLVH